MSEADPAEKGNYHTHALARGLIVLETVAAHAGPVTLSKIHEASGLPKSTIVRLVSVLCDGEYLVRVDERPSYRLGDKVMVLANSYLEALSVPDLARPHLAALAAETRQSANLGVLSGIHVVHLAVEHPSRPFRYDANVGDRAVPYGTGLGKVLLADLAPDQFAAHLPPAPWPAVTATTITTPEALRTVVSKVRELGYAYDDEEWDEGLRCLAVPVVVGGKTIAAVSVSGAAGEFSDEARPRFLKMLRRAADSLAEDAAFVTAIASASRPRD
ncbi:IclR family transcriptional regulator [Arthrobacter sp. KBS0702]|uniref:IclR family transcriptional regulator n=1 Tax=Arthrobacter sp. KBS0702 TaxID=2578107 RepID=UPI00110DC283|nr:IclR family transcriptional regulator [Arthrobacter sp. KBS0702]QDW30635.1 IclR family transcriptional regulator [Arthrobacter sp. KBS0702]